MRIILQNEASECGLACLAMVASHFRYETDLSELRKRFSISLKGATLAQLMRHATVMGLSTRPIRLELHEIPQLKLPCILHWDLNHFVVLKKVAAGFAGETRLIIVDPAAGERKLSLKDMSDHFTGVALELLPSAEFKTKDERRIVKITDLTGKFIGLRRALFQVVALALTLEIFAICAPLFNQFVIDEVIVSGDREMLTVLVMGFALLMITQNAITLARSWFLMRWNMDVSFQWMTRVFAHLIRLPMSFFEKRHLGDIMSRLGSVSSIQNTLTSVFVESALDGIMAVLSLVMMMLYSPKLSAIILVSILVYILIRWFAYQPFKDASLERLILSAKESSHFLETMRAIMPLKLFGRETERLARWQNLKTAVQNRDIQTSKMGILFKVSNTFIFGVQGLAVFYVGAGLVMDGHLTVGMLMAFSSYAGTFTGRVFSLIDVFVGVKMLALHTERLSDIVMTPSEELSISQIDLSKIKATLTLRNVKFKYADGEPWVLNNINLTIDAGESVALVGPSGCGKTTLCKIILGLLKPTEGELLIDGLPLSSIGLQSYRQLVGTVMQEDVLLSGSIMDNISFFDTNADEEYVHRCAEIAAIHNEIVAMPMGYQTLVGDMGSSLSGGQKQRVLLARALYKKPIILALDEATSHLDVDNERRVNTALASMSLTRIMVAHRPEAIKMARRIIQLRDGVAYDARHIEENDEVTKVSPSAPQETLVD